MRKTILFGLLACATVSVHAQTQIIIRRPGEKDQVIRLDSARTGEMAKRLVAEARIEQNAIQNRARLIEKDLAATARLKLDSAPMRIALREPDMAMARDQIVTLENRLKDMKVSFRQPHIGITVDIRPRDTDRYGAYVQSVTPGGPADKAGIVSGDIIIRFGGKSLTDRDSKDARSDDESTPGLRLIGLISKADAGKAVEVELRRGSQNRTVKLTPVEDNNLYAVQPDVFSGNISLAIPREAGRISQTPAPAMTLFNDARAAFGQGFSYSFTMGGLFGSFELAPMNEKLGSYFGTTEGVLVVNNVPERPVIYRTLRADSVSRKMPADSVRGFGGGRGGAAVRAGRVDTATFVDGVPMFRDRKSVDIGLEPGDVIVSVDGRKVTTPSQLMRIVGTYDHGEEFKLQIMRQKRAETLTVKMP